MLTVVSTRGGEEMSMDTSAERLSPDVGTPPRGGASEPGTNDAAESSATFTLDAVDAAIAKAVLGGSYREAILLCVRNHTEAIGRLCMAFLGSQAEAEDVLQETLLAAYRGMNSYRADGSVRGWLLGIARKKCLKQLELRRRTKNTAPVETPASEDNAEELLLLRQRAERARVALLEIRPTEREALLLRYQAELSFEDVAEACSVKPTAARKRVSRGLMHLRQVLSKMEANEMESSS